MEKILIIDNKDIGFKSNAYLTILHKNYFSTPFYKDLLDIENFKNTFDTEPLLRVIWTMAKAYNDDIPLIDEWLKSFENFPIVDIMNSLQPLILNCITTVPVKLPKKKKKKRKQ